MPSMGEKLEDPPAGKLPAFLSFLPAMDPSHRKPKYYFTSMQVIDRELSWCQRDKGLVSRRSYILAGSVLHILQGKFTEATTWYTNSVT